MNVPLELDEASICFDTGVTLMQLLCLTPQVMVALQSHKQIANYPIRMQMLISKYGFLECFNEKRAIVRQGHPPQAFYFIFYGTGWTCVLPYLAV